MASVHSPVWTRVDQLADLLRSPSLTRAERTRFERQLRAAYAANLNRNPAHA